MDARWIRRGAIVCIAVTSVVLGACAGADDRPLEPLSGMPGQPSGLSADDPAEVLGTAVALDDLPEGMYEDVPPGFGERPFEELDLPPDAPPPPVEPGPAPAPVPPPPAAPTPTAPPRSPAPPPASRPSGALDPGSLAAVGDYCTLFRSNGGVLGLANDTMVDGPPARVPDVLTFAEAVFRRGGELAPTNLRASHDQLANALRAYRELLAQHDNRFDLLAASADGMNRLASIETPAVEAAVEAVEGHVSGTCGVSLF